MKNPVPGPGTRRHRVAAYVDGFNLYNGLHQSRGRRGLWLDLESLLGSFLGQNQQIVSVHYFTAPVAGSGAARQRTYLDALRAFSPRTTVHEGRFQRKTHTCRTCGASQASAEEKESDVSLGVQLVEDAAMDVYDQAFIVSGDSDMCPAVRSVRRLASHKRLVAVFPPRRSSVELERAVHGRLQIFDRMPERHQLPEAVSAQDGTVLKRPAHWR